MKRQGSKLKVEKKALVMLRVAAGAFIDGVIRVSYECTEHAKRQDLYKSGMRLVKKLRAQSGDPPSTGGASD